MKRKGDDTRQAVRNMTKVLRGQIKELGQLREDIQAIRRAIAPRDLPKAVRELFTEQL